MRIFTNSEALAQALAEAVAAALQARLMQDGKAALAVSGGTTPLKFFQALSIQNLNWAAVSVTLVDDRWVPESAARSNAGLVRRHLLKNYAAAARFLPLVTDAPTPEAACALVNQAVAAMPLPFTAVVLGMGVDGHTASFFPTGDRLAQALAPAPGVLVETMRAEAAGEPRITLTLPVLQTADYLALHVEGDAKRHMLENLTNAMPVSAVLNHQPAPEIFWSP